MNEMGIPFDDGVITLIVAFMAVVTKYISIHVIGIGIGIGVVSCLTVWHGVT
jgi:hypothetical protein